MYCMGLQQTWSYATTAVYPEYITYVAAPDTTVVNMRNGPLWSSLKATYEDYFINKKAS